MENQDKNSKDIFLSILKWIFSNNGKLIVGLIVGILIGWTAIPYISERILVNWTKAAKTIGWAFAVVVILYLIVISNIDRIQKWIFGENIDLKELKGELKQISGSLMEGIIEKNLSTNNKISKAVVKKMAPKIGNYFIWSFFRGWGFRQIVMILGTLLTFLTTIVAIQNNQLVKNQNNLVEKQNQLFVSQNQLSEASRRSSMVFLMANIMDKMDDELKERDKKKQKRTLSKHLIGRIIALSQSLKPYHYWRDSSTIEKPISPERGQLLITLLESNLDRSMYDSIFSKANFSYAELIDANLSGKYLAGIDLRNANLYRAICENVTFDNAKLEYVNFRECDFSNSSFIESSLAGSDFYNSYLNDCDLQHASLHKANFINAKLWRANLSYSKIILTNFKEADLSEANFQGAAISNVDFSYATVKETNFSNSRFGDAKLTLFELNEAKFNKRELSPYAKINIDKVCLYGVDTASYLNKNPQFAELFSGISRIDTLNGEQLEEGGYDKNFLYDVFQVNTTKEGKEAYNMFHSMYIRGVYSEVFDDTPVYILRFDSTQYYSNE